MNIIDQLRRDEGVRNRMYLDSLGIPTIGVGHNLRDVPISDAAINQILADDLAATRTSLLHNLPWAAQLDEARLGVLLNMAFNIGVGGVMAFSTTLSLVQTGKYADAAIAMLDSRWAKQVGARAQRLAEQMRTGVWQ